jgi:hypothetical protein
MPVDVDTVMYDASSVRGTKFCLSLLLKGLALGANDDSYLSRLFNAPGLMTVVTIQVKSYSPFTLQAEERYCVSFGFRSKELPTYLSLLTVNCQVVMTVTVT